VRAAQFQAAPPAVRVVLDLNVAADALHWTEATDTETGDLIVVVGDASQPPLAPPSVERSSDGITFRVAGARGFERVVKALIEPDRVYIDFIGATFSGTLKQSLPDGPVAELRMAQQPLQGERPVTRLVAELREPCAHSVDADGTDMVLTVGGNAWALPLGPHRGTGALKGKTIVIDPGHGGEDPGAPASPGPPAEGPFEKDIVLDIGLRLARVLNAEGARSVLTRSDDTYITLKGRSDLANKLGADAFVSIHCDSCAQPNTLRGTSVYYDHDHSAPLAELIQKELVATLGTEDRQVRYANFSVIRRTQGPGILVETAFINHEGDRKRLTHPNFRERVARAIAEGLKRFLATAPKDSAQGKR
jgi:N-acetylmuramoyl-L-alanine amidase